jgi:hypothetical protein
VAAVAIAASVGFLAAPAYAEETPVASALVATGLEVNEARLLVASDTPLEGEEILTPSAADCSAWYEICGIVYNRSGRTLELRRDATSHLNCNPANPDLRRSLPSGQDSNKVGSPTWPDVDCFRHNISGCTLFYRGVFYSPGSWIRIYNSVWIYNLNC